MTLTRGLRVGNYEIQSLLGSGGMGEVYLARDLRLGRSVALKVLPTARISEQAQVNRFIQEAFTVSHLNHPNIVTLYEAEYQGSNYFIAMEFVQGSTLQERINERSLKLSETLDVSIQIASALAAAHDAGITHRDIKPGNIMIRPDGYVKVLDFGLVKLVKKRTSADQDAITIPLVQTDPGGRVGTIAYMSPEQANGADVDGRSDLWSLGCVVYEMVAGKRAFDGVTHGEVLEKIIDSSKEVPSIDGPVVLKWIIGKALRRNPDERYQTAREMLSDLRTFQKDLEAKPTSSNKHTAGHSQAGPAQAPHSTNNVKTHKLPPGARKAILISLTLILLSAIALSTYPFLNRHPSSNNKTTQESPQRSVTHLVTGYNAGNASISTDGKQVAYVDWRDNKANLWIRQLSQDLSSRLVEFNVEEPAFLGTTFSPDGNAVYYVMANKKDPRGTLYKVPSVVGRDPQIVRHNVGSPIALSPDGTKFAFIDYEQSGGSDLMVSKIDDSTEPELYKSRKPGDVFGAVAWSPDGKTLAYSVSTLTDCCSMTLVELPAAGGEERRLTSQSWAGGVGQLRWLKDGSGLVLTGTERRGGRSQLWYVSRSDGKARNIVNDLTDYGPNVSVSDDSSTLAVDISESTYSISIWEKGNSRWITNGRYDGIGGGAWTSDGHVIYVTQTNGNYDICIMNADGTNSKLLFSDPALSSQASMSSDGRYIAFSSERERNIGCIWRMDSDGSHLKRLTDGADYAPNFSPDGKWLFFNRQRLGRGTLWKIPVDGGEPIQISDKMLSEQAPSPDGAWVSCMYFDESTHQARPVLVSSSDGSFKELNAPKDASPPAWWRGNREYLYSMRDGKGDTFWTQPISGGKLTKIATFPAWSIQSYDVGSDDRLVVTQRNSTTDIALIKGFRP
jgi:serine/threonine protein kinase